MTPKLHFITVFKCSVFVCVTLSVQQVSHIMQCQLVLYCFCITVQMFALHFTNGNQTNYQNDHAKVSLTSDIEINITMNYAKCLSSLVLILETLFILNANFAAHHSRTNWFCCRTRLCLNNSFQKRSQYPLVLRNIGLTVCTVINMAKAE